MKKFALLVVFLLVPFLAKAQTTSFTIMGGPNIFSQCNVPTGGGDCIQTYETDEGYLYITVNGVQFSALFDAETRSTASFVAQQFADQISNYFGVSVTIDQNGYGEYSSIVSVEIAGNYTLSDAQVVETNSDVCQGCSVWHISY